MIDQLREQGKLADRDIKTMLIMFVDIGEHARSTYAERSQKTELMRIVAKSVLKSERGVYLNTWDHGVIAGFDDPTHGLRCMCKFVQHLDVDGIDARVGVDWGGARVAFDDLTEEMYIDDYSINVGTRLERLASPKEILASDIVVGLPDLHKEGFTFLEREVELEEPVRGRKKGDKLKVFQVSCLPNR